MSSYGRFRYRLQPLLLTRQWALDALKQDLASANARCAKHKQQYERLANAVDDANAAWNERAGAGLALDSFLSSMRYLHDLAAQCSVQQQCLIEVERECAALVDQVGAARRALDAVERHRDDMRAAFVKAGASAHCKESDDQWLMRQDKKEVHEHYL